MERRNYLEYIMNMNGIPPKDYLDELARCLNIKRSSARSIISGRRGIYYCHVKEDVIHKVKRIADYFNVDINFILNEERKFNEINGVRKVSNNAKSETYGKKFAFHRRYLHKFLIDMGFTDESQHANVLAEMMQQADSNAIINSKYTRDLLSGRIGLTGMQNTSKSKPEIFAEIFNVSIEYIYSEEEKFQKEKIEYLNKNI